MWSMKLLIFGLGDYYSKYKRWIRDDYIVGLIDNNDEKQGTYVDGHFVYAPGEISNISYDFIVLLSIHEPQMRRQLIDLGVDEDKLIGHSELAVRKDILNGRVPVELYASESDTRMLIRDNTRNTILIMSPNLDYNGATMVLLYATEILRNAGHKIVFASWHDGDVRAKLEHIDIPIIIDRNLKIETAADIPWIEEFKFVICNTIHHYRFLSHRPECEKIIWWLHDPPCFYDSIDTDILQSINFRNVMVCSAGKLAADAFWKYLPEIDVEILPYGIPDINRSKLIIKTKEGTGLRLIALVIANVQEYKGQDIIIDALEKLTEDERRNISIRIIGNDSSAFAGELKKRAAMLGDCVEFLSFMDRDSIEDEFAEADLLICASREDVMPISVCEAMQRYIPCILSDSIGNSQYITDGYNGLVFTCEDSDALTDKIRWSLYHKTDLVQMGSRSRKIYEEHFSMKVFERNLKQLVDSCFYG